MIRKLRFSHIRSYGADNDVNFSVPESGKVGLTVFVGRNNAGKSTILRLLSDAFDEKPNMAFDKLDRQQGSVPAVDIEFDYKGESYWLGLERSASAWFRKIVRRAGDEVDAPVPGVARGGDPFIAYVPSRRPWNDSFNAEGRASNLQQFDSTARGIRNPNQLADLGAQLNALIASGEKPKFDKILKRVMPEINDWTTDRIAGQDKIVYQSQSKVEHAISDSGDGVVSLFRICFAICKYPQSTPLLLDEPELSLHPEAQRKLYEVIVDVARDRQVIVSTHSPHFVEWRHISEGATVHRVAQNEFGESRVRSPDAATFKRIIAFTENDPRNRKLYDYLAKEMFFQNAIIFLEGQEDVHLLSMFVESEGRSALPFFSYGAGGAGNIKHLLLLAEELGLRGAGVYDGDKHLEYKTAVSEFEGNENIKCFLLEREDIRDKPKRDGACMSSGKCRETEEIAVEGYFDRRWKLKPDARDGLCRLIDQLEDHVSFSR